MSPFAELLGGSALVVAGGPIMIAIMALSVLMWCLILIQYRFFLMDVPSESERLLNEWRRHVAAGAMPRNMLRALLLRRIDDLTMANLGLIAVIAAVLPLLGLLGTVVGMIQIFEVMTVFGSGNTRAMAGGISQALITTMAGLVTALSGLYFVADLHGRADRARETLASRLARES